MSEAAAPYGSNPVQTKGKTLMEIFGEEEENKKRKLDQDLTWEIGKNENAKRQARDLLYELTCLPEYEVIKRIKNLISCLEKPKP